MEQKWYRVPGCRWGDMGNYGEAKLDLFTPTVAGDGTAVTSTFNISDATRALWSVGLICDADLDVRFWKNCAKIYNKGGKEICHFDRKHGLYIAQVRLVNPEHPDFGRPGV